MSHIARSTRSSCSERPRRCRLAATAARPRLELQTRYGKGPSSATARCLVGRPHTSWQCGHESTGHRAIRDSLGSHALRLYGSRRADAIGPLQGPRRIR
jgi:hypothetical protein